MDHEKMLKKLWGDWFYSKDEKKWKTEPFDAEGKPLKRAFVQFIMDPIIKLSRAVMNGDIEFVKEMANKVQVNLNSKD